jgi:hypothetical protein
MSAIIQPSAVREQLRRILVSEAFVRSRRMQRFLEFIVEETLAGRGDQLGEYCIGIAVFDRGSDFEPALDPIVRVDARRLRVKLLEYYSDASSGTSDEVVIHIPKGGYIPVFCPAPPSNEDSFPARQFASELTLSHVIHGSVLRSGEKYRVLLSLIQVPMGRRVWAGAYEFENGELPTVMQEILVRLGPQPLQPKPLDLAA